MSIEKDLPVTLATIAEKARVSRMTVSRALRFPEQVAQDTRKRIETIARRLHFVPNENARALSRRRSGACGLIVPDCTDPAYAYLCEAVEGRLGQAGVQLILCNSHGRHEDFAKAVETLHSRRVDGLIAVGCRGSKRALRRWVGWGAPLVLIEHPVKGFEALFETVRFKEAAQLGTAHLIRMGRERIVLVNGEGPSHANVQRNEGWQTALKENGLKILAPNTGTSSSAKLNEHLAKLFNRAQPPDGVICHDDQTALQVWRFLGQRGMRVPEDVALVGIGDAYHIGLDQLGLTSVSLRWSYLGQSVAGRILNEMGCEVPPMKEGPGAKPDILIRSSCGFLLQEKRKSIELAVHTLAAREWSPGDSLQALEGIWLGATSLAALAPFREYTESIRNWVEKGGTLLLTDAAAAWVKELALEPLTPPICAEESPCLGTYYFGFQAEPNGLYMQGLAQENGRVLLGGGPRAVQRLSAWSSGQAPRNGKVWGAQFGKQGDRAWNRADVNVGITWALGQGKVIALGLGPLAVWEDELQRSNFSQFLINVLGGLRVGVCQAG